MSKNKGNEQASQPSWLERLVFRKIFNQVIKKLENMELKGSWRTSAVGWLTLVLVFGGSIILPVLDGNPATHMDWNAFVAALQNAGIAIPVWLIGILSRDKGVSTEEQRAAKK